jgi:hypothetical protein
VETIMTRPKTPRCLGAIRPEDLSPHDQDELRKFGEYLKIQHSRKVDGDSWAHAIAEHALCHDGLE